MLKHSMFRKFFFPRRKRLKRITLCIITPALIFLFVYLLFGDLSAPNLSKLTELNKCPFCYGISICPELYTNKIILEKSLFNKFFNVKNVFYGKTFSGKPVVLKKLAHNRELENFDKKICGEFDYYDDCNIKKIINDVNEKYLLILIENLMSFNTDSQEYVKNGLILCPNKEASYNIISYFINKSGDTNIVNVLLSIWTLLNVNPEPIVLQLFRQQDGWPVPVQIGTCGRLSVVSYTGVTLSSMLHVSFRRKLGYAHQMLQMAHDFTFKHLRYRIYFLDWSLDNFAIDIDDKLSLVDLEDLIILDKHAAPDKTLTGWYSRHRHENLDNTFTFSVNDICSFHLSDHNIWSATYLLTSGDTPLLYQLPNNVMNFYPALDVLLKRTLDADDKFKSSRDLMDLISNIIGDKNIDID